MQSQMNEELISAYLDGELTDDEQAQVEQSLVTNAAHRQLFDDLQALRSNLQSLPRQRLTRDMTASVISRTAQAMQPTNHSGLPEVQVEPLSRTRLAKSNKHHRAIWVGTALAASLLLAVVFFPRGNPLGVAQNDGQTGQGTTHADDMDSTAPGTKQIPNLSAHTFSPTQTDGSSPLDPVDLPQGMNVAEAEGGDGRGTLKHTPDTSRQMPLSASGNTTNGPGQTAADKDTRLTQHAKNVIIRLDADGDGVISKQEAERDRAVRKLFKDIDQDGDGKLTAEEIYYYLESAASRPRR